MIPEDFVGDTDARIWQAFKAGSESAFAYIYTSNAPLLFNYGRQMVNDVQLIEDCLHDLFVYLHTNRETLGPTDSIKFYLFRSLRRRIAACLKHQQSYSLDLDPGADYNFEMIASHEQQLVTGQGDLPEQEQLIAAINTLPRRQREALYLLYFNGLSYKEIAIVMDAEVRTVYNQVHNALTALKKRFHPVVPLLVYLTTLCETAETVPIFACR